MYLFAITFVVEPRCDADFREWVKPLLEVISKEGECQLYRILDEKHQGHFSYSVQLKVEHMGGYSAAKALLDTKCGELSERFGEGVLFFSTLLKQTEL